MKFVLALVLFVSSPCLAQTYYGEDPNGTGNTWEDGREGIVRYSNGGRERVSDGQIRHSDGSRSRISDDRIRHPDGTRSRIDDDGNIRDSYGRRTGRLEDE